jgi:hypothetical protein
MRRRTTLVLTVGLAVGLLWLLAGCTVADQRPRAEDPNGGTVLEGDHTLSRAPRNGRASDMLYCNV